jgi:hypothetical protein
MKTKNHFLKILGTIIVLSLVLLSCSTTKKTAVSCPEFSINKNKKVAVNQIKNRNKGLFAHNIVKTRKQPISESRKNQEKDIALIKNSPSEDNLRVPGIERESYTNKTDYSEGLLASTDNAIIPLGRNNASDLSLKNVYITEQSKDFIIAQPSGCDTIILKSGSMFIVKVEEIGQNEIKFRECDNLTGSIISISKSDVSLVIYKNGPRYFFSSTKAPAFSDRNAPRETEIFGIAGFISSLLCDLTLVGAPLGGLVGIIFGTISLIRIKKHHDKFKGIFFGIVSILLGIAGFVIFYHIVASIGE